MVDRCSISVAMRNATVDRQDSRGDSLTGPFPRIVRRHRLHRYGAASRPHTHESPAGTPAPVRSRHLARRRTSGRRGGARARAAPHAALGCRRVGSHFRGASPVAPTPSRSGSGGPGTSSVRRRVPCACPRRSGGGRPAPRTPEPHPVEGRGRGAGTGCRSRATPPRFPSSRNTAYPASILHEPLPPRADKVCAAPHQPRIVVRSPGYAVARDCVPARAERGRSIRRIRQPMDTR